MPGNGRFPPQSERCRRTIPRQASLATMKNRLNEEDIPLFTHHRCPIGERQSTPVPVRLAPARLLLAAEIVMIFRN